MVIGELILSKSCLPYMRAVAEHYGESRNDPSMEQISVVTIRVKAGCHSWWGTCRNPHDGPEWSRDPGDVVDAPVLGRPSHLRRSRG